MQIPLVYNAADNLRFNLFGQILDAQKAKLPRLPHSDR